MNSSFKQGQKQAHHLGYWLMGILLLIAFGLADAAVVAVPAMAISLSELLAAGLAFLLIAGGLLFTVWRLER